MARFKSRELDQWATALGVTNDDDALRVLFKVLVLVTVARQECDALVRATTSAPDDAIYKNVLNARVSFDLIDDSIRPVYLAFRRHARGRG